MNPKTYLTIGMIIASCVLPASASAATTTGNANVRADAQASVRAFEKAKVLTQAGRDGAAAAKVKLGLRELRAAARTTARMRRSAGGDAALARVVRAERTVGQSADIGASTLATVVAEADVSVDVDIAAAISSLLTIHQRAIGALAATVEVGSDAVDAVAVTAIVGLNANINGVIGAISAALASTDVSVQAAVSLDTALTLATETMSGSLAILQTLSGDVSATLQGSVTVAIGQVTDALVQTQVALQALIGTVTPVATGAVGSIVLPTLNSLLGSVSVALSVEVR